MGDRLATVDMGRKVEGLLCPLFGWQLGPRITQYGQGRGILIHPTVWPPYINVTESTDRTGQTDNDPIAQSELFLSNRL